MSTERLNELTKEMSGLCAELDREGLTPSEREGLSQRAMSAVAEMDSDFSIVAFPPAVPSKTQSMFFRLQKLVCEG